MEPPPVQYVTTSDGYRIAYSVCGAGRPLIFMSPQFMDIQQVWRILPVWMEGLAKRFTLIQYNPRGEGLSTRDLPEAMIISDYLRDIDAIGAKLGLRRFSLWAFGGRTHIAVGYAARYPELVEALILIGPAAVGKSWSVVVHTMLPNDDWDLYLRTSVLPGLSSDEARERAREYKRAMNREDWLAWMRCITPSDISQELGQLTMPVLVMHARDGVSLAPEASVKVAALIPKGRSVALDGEYSLEASVQGLEAMDHFYNDVLPNHRGDSFVASTTGAADGLSSREVEVLRLIAGGRSNPQIADELVISLNTVQRHVSNILAKTGCSNRADAASYATRNGIA